MSHLLGKVSFGYVTNKFQWKNCKQYQAGIEVTKIHHSLVLSLYLTAGQDIFKCTTECDGGINLEEICSMYHRDLWFLAGL